MQSPETLPFATGLAGVYSARCPGAEGPNEDAAALIPFGDQAGVLVVADGLGGSPTGHKAAGLAIKELQTAVEQAMGTDLMLRTAIINGFENANRAVFDLASGAATTMAAVEIQEKTVRPYHVGDSMILITGSRGKIKHQTVSHSPVGYGVEAGLLDEAEAINHEHRHIVSNTIGSSDMHIEVGPSIELAARDTLLLATDGLADNLGTDEIVAQIRKGPLVKAMKHLISNAGKRMTDPTEGTPSKPDDMTLIGFRLVARKDVPKKEPLT